jgi:hypothetical protein
VTSRAQRYQEHARECLILANMLPPGPRRDAAIEMAYEWARLAEEQGGAPRLDDDDDDEDEE